MLRPRCIGFCAQSEKQELEDQLTQKAADADALHSELQERTADHQNLTQTLSSTQAELRSSVEQALRTEEELRELRRASEAQEAEATAELESAKAQAGQITRQLSGRMQRLDALQVLHKTCSCYATSTSIHEKSCVAQVCIVLVAAYHLWRSSMCACCNPEWW